MPVNPKRLESQLRHFKHMLESYTGRQPLSMFLTSYFRENKQMGSKDRRQASRWAYHLFRIGSGLGHDSSVEDRLICGEFLCANESDLVAFLRDDLLQYLTLPVADKLVLAEELLGLDPESVFPLVSHISASIDGSTFLEKLFVQPALFIRVLPDDKAEVMSVLDRQAIAFEDISASGLALVNGTSLDRLKELRGKFQVQDYSSQQTLRFFEAKERESWWDACAASGGKAMLLKQSVPSVQLLVSDVRSSILRNLDERFEAAGIGDYRKKLLDLTKDVSPILGNERFDGIILDAPCSGSGTWGRTPEMMRQFSKQHLMRFVQLQRQIISHVAPFLKRDCPLIYITCSAYADENELQVTYMERELDLCLERMESLKGYLYQADTMFVARMIKR